MKALYLSYDGLMEQLGQSQILPYLRLLAPQHDITLLSYEKPEDLSVPGRLTKFRALAKTAGIKWIPLRYHRRPSSLATAYDLGIGTIVAAWLCLFRGIQIVHARSYVMAVVGLVMKRFFSKRFIFDMRGFWIDQRIEMGVWREDSLACRIARWVERAALQDADVVFSLSRNAVDAMRQWPAAQGRDIQFEVVTTCADLKLFTPKPTPSTKTDSFVLGYVGNAGRGYLFEPAVKIFIEIQRRVPQAHFHIINRNDHASIRAILQRHNVDAKNYTLEGCDHSEVPNKMHAMDAGVFFVVPDPSRALASVPTRLGEYLACGVPCIGNTACAEVADILEGNNIGVAPQDFTDATLTKAATIILTLAKRDDVRLRCVEAANSYFSLGSGVKIYDRAYKSLAPVSN
jgi:glycosyltransferase involved in cell wall biosynthesis